MEAEQCSRRRSGTPNEEINKKLEDSHKKLDFLARKFIYFQSQLILGDENVGGGNETPTTVYSE